MKRFKIWGATLVAALAFVSAGAQSAQNVAEKMTAAGELINDKKFVESIPLLEEAINLGLDAGDEESMTMVAQAKQLLPKMYLQKGVGEVRGSQFDAALASLEKAEDLADLEGDTQTQRQASRLVSNIYMQQGIESFNAKDFNKAIESFQKGNDRDPSNIQLAYYTAKSYAELNDLDQAMELYQKVIAAGSANSRYAKEAADAKTDMDTYLLVAASEAAKAGDMESLVKYVEAIPDNADAGLILVQTANNRKLYDTVIANGSAAYEAQTDAGKKSEIAYLMGIAYQNKGNNARSIEWLKRVTSGSNVSAAKALIADLQ